MAHRVFHLWHRTVRLEPNLEIRGLKYGGASVLVNGAVFKTVSETARAGSGRFDSYTPPPTKKVGSSPREINTLASAQLEGCISRGKGRKQ